MQPLVVHVLHSLGTGGMERVVVSIINRTGDRYRHAIVCLADVGATRALIEDSSIECIALGKRPGKDWRCYARLWRALRRLRPELVQTCNIGALDAALVARLAGVKRIVHAEHGRDVADPLGRNRKYRRMRRWLQPCITRFVAVSQDLANWLRDEVGIRPAKIVCIPNGIDTRHCAAAVGSARPLLGDFAPSGTFLIGTVGRLNAVKNQAGLVDAFALLREADPARATSLRLAIVGEGAERDRLEQRITQHGLGGQVRLLGNRADVPALLAEFDIFALSSVAEGIPLTVLEAMAAALPVVATKVGGVGEVVVDHATGLLVAPSDPRALAVAMQHYADDPGLCKRHGDAGRARVVVEFGLAKMVAGYVALFDGLLSDRRRTSVASTTPTAGRGEH